MALTDKHRQLIEDLGVLHEGMGMQPAAGRVMGLLLVSDTTELTFEEIVDLLQLSKSAVSNALTMLQGLDRVDYITYPGDRKRYFRAKPKSVSSELERAMMGLAAHNGMLKRVLEQRPAATKEFNTRLEEAIDFADFIVQEMPALLEKWQHRRKR